MDFVDIVLYFGYFMVCVAALLAVGFPLYIASKNPKSLINSGMGLGSILILFLIAWLISGKLTTNSPFNFRFMYAEADDYEGTWTIASGNDNLKNDSGADMTVLGVYYSLGDSTEFGLTYNEVSNDTYGAYGTGIGGIGLGSIGSDNEIIALNVITMF